MDLIVPLSKLISPELNATVALCWNPVDAARRTSARSRSARPSINTLTSAYSGACEYRFQEDVNKDSGHVNRDSGDVNNPNRDEGGGLEPGLILTFLDRAFWVGADRGAGQPKGDV